MAFNPFDVFRRNQKILFSILTVFIMIMFTLSFGQGDFFTTIQNYFGAKTRKGETLAVIDGSKFTESELFELNRRRELANTYMVSLSFRARQSLQSYVTDGLNRVSSENRPIIQTALNCMTDQQQFQQLDRVLVGLDSILKSKSPKQTDLDIAQSAKSMLGLFLRQLRSNQRLYFDNAPNLTSRDQVEFALWQRKADKLGIYFSDADVALLIQNEFGNRVDNNDLAEAEKPLRGRGTNYKPLELRAALAEEFRVRAAQQLVLGQSFISLPPSGSAPFEAPFDAFEFYNKETNPAQYGLISFPAEAYISQVTENPTETQLIKLFNEARNIEPDPGNARAALREPRRLKLEWIEVKGDETFYKNLAKTTLPLIELQAKLAYAVGLPVGFPTIASTATALIPLVESDLALQAKYRTYKSGHETKVNSEWFMTPWGGSKPLDTDVIRKPQWASLVAAFAQAGASYAGPFGAASTLVGEAYLNNRKARLTTIPAVTLVPALPGSFAPSILTAVASQAVTIQPLPLSAVRTTLSEETQTELARKLAEDDIKKFGEELTKLGAKDDKKEVNEYIAKMVKERGWKTGKSAQARDMHTIIDDPGLLPLKDRYGEFSRQLISFRMMEYPYPGIFGSFFFYENALFNRGAPLKVSEGLYKLIPYPLFSGLPAFQVWRVEDQAGETLKDIRNPEVRMKVEALWRKLEARKLAKKAAEEVAAKSTSFGRSKADIPLAMRDKAAELASKFSAIGARPQYFEMSNIAPLVGAEFPNMMGGGMRELAPFRLAPSANILFPTEKMLKELLDNKDKPFGTSVVLNDRPEDNYYVAVVFDRETRTVQDFAEMAYGIGIQSIMSRRTINDSHQFFHRKDAREAAVALLKAELGYDKENAELLDKNRTTSEFE